MALAAAVWSCSGRAEESTPEPSAAASTGRPFHVVLVSLDTLRVDHLSLHGYERSTSPFLESLAGESVVFDNAISHSSHTAPAHRALFQSQIASQLSKDVSTLPRILRRAGYQTAAFTGGAKVSAEFGFDESFDEFKLHFGGFSTASRRVGEWLALEHDRPFLLFVHTYDVHLPYNPPAPFDTSFFPEYQGWVTGPKSREAVQRIADMAVPAAERPTPDPEDLRKLVALYDGGILYADSQIERLVNTLKDLSLWPDTLFIVLSDHGEEFWDHRGMGHGFTLYQEMIHVPLIIHFPQNRFAGKRVQEAVGLIDILPTILDVLDLEADPGHQGTSLLPLLRGDQTPRPAILSQTLELSSLLAFPWKLIVAANGGESVLYHLVNDPDERTDVAHQHPEIVKRLERELAEILASSPQLAIEAVNPEGIEDEELRKQLEALGYLDGQ